MVFYYFKLARKNLIKNKYYTAINIIGLVFGMLSALIIAKYVGGSLQFDSFHSKKELIYSLNQKEFFEGNQRKERNSTYLGVADFLSQVPEATNFTKYYKHVESLVIAEQDNGNVISFTEGGIFISDPSFFKIFTFPFIQGSEKTALATTNSIVITRSTSERYFGNSFPVGKSMTIRTTWGEEKTYEVSGVIDDIPKLSRFKFDFLIIENELNTDEYWTVPDYSVYLLLKKNANPSLTGEKLTSILKDVPQLKSANKTVSISLESVADVPLSITDYLLLIVGIFIILISWINYINQIIAQSYWRIKEVGVLRIMGAARFDLIIQFVIESGLICLISLILIMAIYLGLEPSMQAFTNGHLLPLIGDPTSINLIIIAIFGVGTVITALVPTIVLLSQDFGASLGNIYNTKIGSVGLRKALVIFQFSVSTVLMISIFVISGQLEYLQAKDKGLDMENIIVVKAPMAKDTTFIAKRQILRLFKERCSELPIVVDVTSSTTVPGEEYRRETFLSFEDINTKKLVHQSGVDDHFFSLYNAKFVAGDDFISDALAKNRTSIILNESAAKALGISDYQKAVNAKIVDYEEPELVYNLIGIVKDFHQTSIKYEVKPMAFKFNNQRGHSSLKIRAAGSNGTEVAKGLASIKRIWKESYPDVAFEYFFLDEKFAAQDTENRHFGRFFKYFTILSIVISCLGLFGLSLLLSVKRQREIGVRKVLGASSIDVLALFLKSYLVLLLISFIIGTPIAYFLMDKWLMSYAYKIEIGLWTILFAAISLATIFLGTVSYHTLRSSMTNPVNILKE